MRRHRTYISFEPDQIPKMDLIAKKLGGLDRADITRMAIIDFIEKHKHLLEEK